MLAGGDMLMDVNLVYMTAGSVEEARTIGKVLVTEQLAACVNIVDGMNSIYLWDNELQEDREVILIAKTTRNRVSNLTQRVKSIHSYDCPCILSLPVSGGNSEFLDWIAQSTAR